VIEQEEMSLMVARMSSYIDAPVEKVFDFFKDPTSQIDNPPFGSMEVHDVTMTEEGVGTHYSWTVKMAGLPLEGFAVYTEFVPNERIVEKDSRSFVGEWEYTFTPDGSGTRVTMEHRQRSLWAFPLLSTAVDYAVRRLNQRFIEGVKAKLETGPTVPGQRKPRSTGTRRTVGSR
jgi:uncharacterized protein YndB with AHSA1/START domain